MTLEFKRKTPPGRFPWSVNDRENAARLAALQCRGREVLALDVDFGLYAAQQAFGFTANEYECEIAVPLLFHRAVELLDAVDILLAAGASLPARTMARCMMEAVLSMRYLATVDRENIAAAYLIASDAERSAWPRAIAARGLRGPKPAVRTHDAEAKFRAALGMDFVWEESRDELERIRRDEGPATPWFRVFGGPRNLADLISAIPVDDLSNDLRIILARWSQTVHSTDWSDAVDFEKHVDPNAVSVLLHPLRHLHDDFDEIVFVCHGLFCAGVETITDFLGLDLDGTIEWEYGIKRLYREK